MTDELRDLIADLSVPEGQGLYVPPLSRASVGIRNVGVGNHAFAIKPTVATVASDLMSVVLGKVVDWGTEAASKKYVDNVYRAATATSCAKTAHGLNASDGPPDQSAVKNYLGGDGLDCVHDLLAIAGRPETAQGTDMDGAKGNKITQGIAKIAGLISRTRGSMPSSTSRT